MASTDAVSLYYFGSLSVRVCSVYQIERKKKYEVGANGRKAVGVGRNIYDGAEGIE